jgi:hypothetical protein
MTQGLNDAVSPIAKYVGSKASGVEDWAADKFGPAGGAAASTLIEGAPYALGAGPEMSLARAGVRGAATAAPRIAEGIGNIGRDVTEPASSLNSAQSMGAARPAPSIDDLSPPLQQAVKAASEKTGTVPNQEAFDNHAEADRHGVQLTEGQATRDAAQYSNEQNSTHPDIVKRLGDQNGQLTDAFDNIRREAAPATVQNDPIENGQIAVDSLKAYDEPVKADINAKYDAARAASAKGDLQMDGSSFVSDANAALKPQSKFRFLPSTVKGILDDVANADGKMTLDDYQAYETQLGNEIAKAKASGDGNAVAAIGKVKDALQNIEPMTDETAQAKTLFDTARKSAKARFDALDADPAYQAAVDDVSINGVKKGVPSALADKFLDKYALQAPKANVDRLMSKLDTNAQQAVTSHTLSTIRNRAVTNNGAVSPSGFTGAVNKYSSKLGSLVPPEAIESLDSLGRVIHNVKTPPQGHFVNYSKSGVISNAAHGVAQPLGEAIINAHTFGTGVPIIKDIINNKFAKKSLEPGAGLTTPPRVPDSAPITRSTGGKVDHEALVERLIQRWRAAKKETDKSSEKLLKVPDATIVKALEISQRAI